MASAAADAPSVNAQLADLIARAEASAAKPSTNMRNRQLLEEMSFAIVALAQRVVQLQAQAEPSRIVLP